MMAGGRCGIALAFPAVRPTVVALSFGAPVKSKTSPLRHSGAVCVWNLASYDKYARGERERRREREREIVREREREREIEK